MPIVVRHTPVGLLTRLAVESGQARRRDIQAQRDIQIQQTAWAAEERGADIAARRAEQQQAQTFAIQRAGVARIARERPVTPESRVEREQLHQAVIEAKESGLYRPEQIKLMQMRADLGDKTGISRELENIPRPQKPLQPTTRRRELAQQYTAITQMAKENITPLQEQLTAINEQLHSRFTPGTLQLFRERPEYLETAPEETRGLIEQQQQVQNQIEQIQRQTSQTQRMLELGVSVPEQMATRDRQERYTQKLLIDEHKRQTTAAAGITPRQKLAIDVVRDNQKDARRRFNKEIASIDSEMLPFIDDEGEPTESPEEYTERVEPLRKQKLAWKTRRTQSENDEKKEIEAILRGPVTKKKYEIGKTYRSSSGKRVRYIGTNDQGQNQFQEVD